MSNQLRVAGLRLVIEGAGEFQASLDRTEQEIKENRAQLKLLDAQYGKTDKSAEKLGQQQKLLGSQLDQQKAKLDTMRAAYARYTQQEKMSQKSADALRVAIMKQEAAVADLQRRLQETRWDRFAQEMTTKGQKNVERGIRWFRNALATVGVAFGYSAKEAVAFEDAFQQVVKTVDGSDEALEALKKQAVDLAGSGAITQAKEEVAQIMAVAGQLGISVDHIGGFSEAMLKMADATNLSSEEAATQLAQFANIARMSQEEFENLGSAIVALGNNTATQEDAIVSMGMRIAAAGTQAGMSQASIMGISAALSSLGIEAEAGGTAISRVLINMDTAAAQGEKAMKGYAEVAGMSSKAFKELWDTSSEQAFTAFIEGLGRIDAQGGNVAATLEKLGYTEVRTRDALMRAALAGEMMGESISLANGAYAENTALAEEAAKKNSTFAARLKVLKNQADNAAMGLGEAMMPALEEAMKAATGLVGQFAALTEEQRQTILTMGGMALAAGPVVSALGTVEKGVGYAAKGFAGLKSVMAGSGWAGFAIAGLAGLSAALASLQTPLAKAQERLANMDFTVDPDLAGKINAGVQAGIDGAQKAYQVTLQVDAQVDLLGDGIDSALSDGKLSNKERKSLKKQLDEMVKADVDAAQEDLQASVDAYVLTLSGLKDAAGQDIFSAEEKAKVIADIEAKTSGLITELETYQDEYNKLLDVIYKSNKPVTAQQMAELDALLAKIRGVRSEIALAMDAAAQAAKAQYDVTVAGRGDEYTAGAATGYVKGNYDAQIQAAGEARDAMMAASMAMEDQAQQLEAQAEAARIYQEAVSQAAQEAQEGFAAILSGEARRMGLEEEAEQINSLSLALEAARTAMAAMEGMELPDVQNTLKGLFGEGGALEGYQQFMKDWDQVLLGGMLDSDETIGPEAIKAVRDAMGDVMTGLMNELANVAESTELDPLTTLFQTMFDAGAFDPETLDLTQAEGALAAVLNLMDLSGKGETYGYDFSVGVGSGMGDGKEKVQEGSEKLVDAAGSGLAGMSGAGSGAASAMISGMVATLKAKQRQVYTAAAAVGAAAAAGVNSKGGIDAGSPSKKARQSARWVAEGLTEEMDAMSRSVKQAGAKLGESTLEGLDARIDRLVAGAYRPNVNFSVPIAGSLQAMERYAAKGAAAQEVVQNDYSSFNFNVGQLVVREEADARAVALEASSLMRRRNAGYGG